MNAVDRALQRWRVRRAARYIPDGAHVLDVGTADGALFRALGPRLGHGVGVDPDLRESVTGDRYELRKGSFPDALDEAERFDAVVLLAVLEHVPEAELETWVAACHRYLRPSGRLVLSVPSPRVDAILDVLIRLRVLHGMETSQHHGFDVSRVPDLFGCGAGFAAVAHHRFQLGLNNLFVFDAVQAAVSHTR